MQFWREQITEKSFQVLKKLRQEFNFILIGDWAVFLYSKTLKSKDIDIVIDYDELEKIKSKYEINKNERLRKYEIKIEGVDIDIYLLFYSNLGIPAEKIKNYTISQQGFIVPKPELLLVLKQKTYQARQRSIKSEKDKIDIISLLNFIDFDFYQKLLNKLDEQKLKSDLINLLKNSYEVKELGLNQQKMARRKKQWISLLG